MTLDNEQQRAILLQLIESATIPVKAIDIILQLKAAIRQAAVETKIPSSGG